MKKIAKMTRGNTRALHTICIVQEIAYLGEN